jgi:hypothetical protein
METITEHLDNAAIHAIAADFGPYLEKLTNGQKLELMGFLALWIAVALNTDDEVHWSDVPVECDPNEDVEDILNHCDDLAPDEALVFITSIANTVTMEEA